jgi:hypothetical protein
MGWLLALFWWQAAGEGWVSAVPREVQRTYFDLLESTEVSVFLLPDGLQGEPPLVEIKDTSMRLVVDDEVFDLGEPCKPLGFGGPCQILYSGSGSDAAIAGISAEIRPELLQRLAHARAVTGTALGFPIRLSSKDLEAVGKFAESVLRKTDPRQ